ncbi:unnamed protein product, partial [Staurois parvus]
MSCQSAPAQHPLLFTSSRRKSSSMMPMPMQWTLKDLNGMHFWVWFECGRGHRGPMIPYCPGAP